MFPFESLWRWLLAPGYLHIVEAIREHMEAFQSPYDDILRDRASKMEAGLKIRGVVMVLLNVGVIATGLAWLARVVSIPGGIRESVAALAGSLTGVSLALTGLYLLVTRYLGQLQADMISSMALGTPVGHTLSAQEKARLERLEHEARERGWLSLPGSAPDEETKGS